MRLHTHTHTHSPIEKWNTWSTCCVMLRLTYFSGFWLTQQMFVCINRCYQTPIVSLNNHHFYPIAMRAKERMKQKNIDIVSFFIDCSGSSVSFHLCIWWFSCVDGHLATCRQLTQSTNRCTNDTHIAHCAYAMHNVSTSRSPNLYVKSPKTQWKSF